MSRSSALHRQQRRRSENGQILFLASLFVTLCSLITWGLLSDLGRHKDKFLSEDELIQRSVAYHLRIASLLNAIASNNATLERLFFNWIGIQSSSYSQVSNLIWSTPLWEKNIPIPSPFNPLVRAKAINLLIVKQSFMLTQQNQALLELLPDSVKMQLQHDSLTHSLCVLLKQKRVSPAQSGSALSPAQNAFEDCAMALNKAWLAPPSYRQVALLDILPSTLASSKGFVKFRLNAPFHVTTEKEDTPLESRGNRRLKDVVFVVHPHHCHRKDPRIVLPCPNLNPQQGNAFEDEQKAAFKPQWSVHVVP